MDVQFLGGAGEVGRSGILLKGKKNMLLDYGVKLDTKIEYPMNAGRVDAFILSHAHLDHSGNAPALYSSGSPVSFGTPPTLKLSELLLEDSMKISRKNRVAHRFSKRDYRNFQRKYVSYDYKVPIDFGEYQISLHDAGHISGSSMPLIEDAHSGKRLLYTGDFKLSPQLLRHGAEIVKADVLITESTYATSEHPDRRTLEKAFIDDVKQTIENKGTALVAVFAVGRAQELLALLYNNRLIDFTYVDGMAKKASDIAMQYPGYIDNESLLRGAMDRVNRVGDHEGRGNALAGGNIIVTTAGMLNGGPILNYILKLGPASKIFLTGYQVETTNGRKLMEGRPVEIDGQKHRINTPWAFYDFSAHADKNDLYRFVREVSPQKVLCVHGDRDNSRDMAEALKLEGFDAHAPLVGERLRIDI